MTYSQAQNINDGLRYSTEDNTGTARFTALSGAMGALGGDVSAMRVNPAGGAVFVANNVTLTASLTDKDNKATYFNHMEKSYSNKVNLNQAGGVFVFNNPDETSVFKKFTIGFNYDTTKNLDDELFIAGIGNTSIGNFFLEQAQGIPLELLQLQGNESISDLYAYLGETQGTNAQNAFLGYQGYLFNPLDPDNPSNTQYTSNIADGHFNQEFLYLSKGYNSKFTLNLATQITDDFYVGANLNTHSISFRRSTLLVETNSNPGSTVTAVGFENNLYTRGAGISAQIGGIAKIANNLRVGLSFETPTWFDISEETTQYLETRRLEDRQSITTSVNPNVRNIFESYTLRTPGKLTGSLAYIFGQSGLLSFDYSYKDHSNIKFSPNYSASYFNSLNNNIGNTLTGASTYRLGGEYRLDQLSLRGGYHYEETPYKDSETLGDMQGFSFGMGYNLGSYFFDLAYSRSEQDRFEQMYSVGLTDPAKVKTVYSHFLVSVGFNF